MSTTSSQRGLSVPVVSSDSGLWGSELNTTFADLDSILGATTIIQSSAGLSQTLTTSMAQTQRINVQGSPTGTVTLTFPSSLYANGLYSVWNTTASSLAFGVLCQTTGAGATCTVPVNTQRLVQVDGTNAYFADQPPVPSFNIPPVLQNFISGMIVSNSSVATGLNVGAGLAADQSNAAYLPFGGMTKSAASLWAAGTGNGGMGNGLGFNPGTTYHIFEISNSTNNASSNIASSSIDIYFDTSVTAANAPINTNFFRRIFSLKTPSSAAVWPLFLQRGNDVFVGNANIVSGGGNYNAATTIPNIPTGISVEPFLAAFGSVNPGPGTVGLNLGPAGNPGYGSFSIIQTGGANASVTGAQQWAGIGPPTNTAAQIQLIAGVTVGAGAGPSWVFSCYGYNDLRGKEGAP